MSCPQSDKKGKDLKRQTLLELVDYVNTPAGQKIFTEALMPEVHNFSTLFFPCIGKPQRH